MSLALDFELFPKLFGRRLGDWLACLIHCREAIVIEATKFVALLSEPVLWRDTAKLEFFGGLNRFSVRLIFSQATLLSLLGCFSICSGLFFLSRLQKGFSWHKLDKRRPI